MAQTRRLELFDRLVNAGSGIRAAASEAGISKTLGYERAGKNSTDGKFTTAAQKESKVRDAIEEHPESVQS